MVDYTDYTAGSREYQRLWTKQWRVKYPKKARLACAKYRKNHPEKGQDYYKNNKSKLNENSKKSRKAQREALFSILGRQCVKCKFSDPKALQFDHINGGGNKEFRENGNYQVYKYYLTNPDIAVKTLQVLCANCNWTKRHENKEFGGRWKN